MGGAPRAPKLKPKDAWTEEGLRVSAPVCLIGCHQGHVTQHRARAVGDVRGDLQDGERKPGKHKQRFRRIHTDWRHNDGGCVAITGGTPALVASSSWCITGSVVRADALLSPWHSARTWSPPQQFHSLPTSQHHHSSIGRLPTWAGCGVAAAAQAAKTTSIPLSANSSQRKPPRAPSLYYHLRRPKRSLHRHKHPHRPRRKPRNRPNPRSPGSPRSLNSKMDAMPISGKTTRPKTSSTTVESRSKTGYGT